MVKHKLSKDEIEACLFDSAHKVGLYKDCRGLDEEETVSNIANKTARMYDVLMTIAGRYNVMLSRRTVEDFVSINKQYPDKAEKAFERYVICDIAGSRGLPIKSIEREFGQR